jgi:hypothetical protein
MSDSNIKTPAQSFDKKQYYRDYRKKNIDKLQEYQRDYYKTNRQSNKTYNKRKGVKFSRVSKIITVYFN